ncbi:MAG: glycosyltransferase family 2 protein, partial [Clostridia bacterium]|nr:glycosyltransferase family 2 protein [Clostridia bacterium]
MCDLTVIILTFNEEKNIDKCISSTLNLAKRVVIVDSYSNDSTVSIAKDLGCEVVFHEFVNQADSFNFALENLDISTKWILRLDADEQLTSDSANEISNFIEENDETDVNGALLRFNVNFLGRELRHGGIYPFRKLVLFKKGKAHMEQRHMDEHIVLDEGSCLPLKCDNLHCDYKDLSTWIDKHNKYSSREVLDYLTIRDDNSESQCHKKLNFSARVKRFIKTKIYYKLPMGTRAHLYY